MPTTLPHRRRADEKHSPARIVFEFLFNAAMVVSALILTFIVLVREEQYAGPLDATGESLVIPPSN